AATAGFALLAKQDLHLVGRGPGAGGLGEQLVLETRQVRQAPAVEEDGALGQLLPVGDEVAQVAQRERTGVRAHGFFRALADATSDPMSWFFMMRSMISTSSLGVQPKQGTPISVSMAASSWS